EFRVADVTAGPLPRADLIFCRDCLVHLPFADVINAVAAFKKSASRYVLTTTFTAREANDDVAPGGWRPLNLERPPFAFPRPLRVITDACPVPGYADKSLGLWEVRQLP